MVILTGKQFLALAQKKRWNLVKYLGSNDFSRNIYNFPYKFGLNEMKYSSAQIRRGNGIQFQREMDFSKMDWHKFSVTVPENAIVSVEDGKFKTNKIIIEKEIKDDPKLYNRIIRANPKAIKYLRKPTREQCLRAVKNGAPLLLSRIPYRSEAFIVSAINNGEIRLNEVEKQTKRICLAAVRKYGGELKYVIKQTPEICREAVINECHALKYVKMPTKEIILTAIEYDEHAAVHVENWPPELALEAVKLNGLVIQYLEQTPDLCLEAVKQNGLALEFIKEQNFELCFEAVKQNVHAYYYVLDKSRKLNMEILKNDEETKKIMKRDKTYLIDARTEYIYGCDGPKTIRLHGVFASERSIFSRGIDLFRGSSSTNK